MRPYGDLYQGRRTPPPMPDPEPQRLPSGESFIDFQRRVRPPSLDASAGLTEAERRQAKEIKRLIDAGQWGLGNVIPNKLMAAVFDGAPRQGEPFSLEAATDPTGTIARQVNATLSASMATDRPTPRTLASDAPRKPAMSYKLAQVMGDYALLDEESFGQSMDTWGVIEPRDRIGLKAEATALGMMRQHGQAPKLPARYIQAPHVKNPRLPHFISKDSPAAQKSTAGRPDTPKGKYVPTMRASTPDGRCAYDKTSISFPDDSGLSNL